MNLISTSSPVKLQLSRDLVKTIKRGHAWVYANALRSLPKAPPGTPAILLDNRGGREIARGYFDPISPIAFRVCSTSGTPLDQQWAETQMTQAIALRKRLFDPRSTTGYRLFNGEGDDLPGLVVDIYNRVAVVVTDGIAPGGFWQVSNIAEWLAGQLDLDRVIHRSREMEQPGVIIGSTISDPIRFLENGLQFTADLIHGQKTGFFLDQRENRQRIIPLAQGRSVLNVFGYTGGFSVYAGKGGAERVTTLDTAAPALEFATHHWKLNNLDPGTHATIHADAFEFLAESVRKDQVWDLVILDPPSFAPSENAVPQAVQAYTKLIALGAQCTAKKGIIAAASCSSHIHTQAFLDIIENAVSQARRKAAILGVYGQPPDHPAPLVMPELRYLKFVLLHLD